jgi:hypothetical protein
VDDSSPIPRDIMSEKPLIDTHTDELAHGEVHPAGWCGLCERVHMVPVLRSPVGRRAAAVVKVDEPSQLG